VSRLVSERIRGGAAAACLVVLGLGLASPLPWPDVRRDFRRLLRALGGGAAAPAQDRGFWFDPAYADFLEDVKRLTPSDATVAVLVPPHPDLYRHQAVHELVPRRVVDRPLEGEAQFIAVYRAGPCGAGAVAVRGGQLCRK